MANENLRAAISLTDNFTPQLRNISNAISTISANLNDLEFSKTFDPSKVKAMNQAAQTLDRSVSDLEKGLDSAAQSVEKVGKKSTSTKGDVQGLSDTLESLTEKADFSNMLQGFQVAQGIVSSVTSAIGAVGTTVFEAAETVSSSTNKIRMGLGATAQEAEVFENIAQDVFRDNFGESLDEVTDRLVYVQQVMGDMVNQADLQPLVEQFITLDDNGMDFNETVRGATNLMTYFGISAQEATDLLATGMQRGLNFSDELGDNLAEYAGRWAEAGVSASSYFSLLEAGTNSGAYNLDKVGDFLNEFLTSLSDGRLQENLGAFTEGTQEVFAAYQSGGANAQDVLNAVLTDMSNMASETDKAALSSTLWSSLGEDNALGMIQALNGVTDTYTNIDGAAQEMALNNSNSVSQMYRSWEAFKLSLAPVGEALAGIANTALTYLTPFVDYLTANGDRVVYILSAIGGGIAAFATYSFVAGVMETITAATEGMTIANAALNVVLNANPIMLIVTAIGALVGAIIYLWNTNEGFRNAVTEAFNAIVGSFQTAYTNITNIFTALAAGWDQAIATVQNFWANLTNTVSGWRNAAYEWGSNLIQGFLEGLGSIWNNITTWVTDSFNWIVTSVKSIFGIASPSTVFSELGSNLLQGFWNGLTAIWDGITQWATNAWNWLTNLFGGGGEEDSQLIDYSAQIENTRTQLAQLQSEVELGYKNILQVVSDNTSLIVSQGITMFSSMSATIITDSANMVAGISANLHNIPTIMAEALAGTLVVTQEYLIRLQGQMVQQIELLVAQSNAALLTLVPTSHNILEALRVQSITILYDLQKNAVNIINTMSTLVVSGIDTMNKQILSLVNYFTATYLTAWNNVVNQTLSILSLFVPKVVSSTQKLVDDVSAVINTMPGIFRSSANNAMASFIDGINSQRSGAIDATNALVSAVKDAFVKGLGIHSPSDETYFYGQMTGQGFIEGLSDSELVQFAESILKEMIEAFSAGRFKPDELVAYLGDDTLKVISSLQEKPELMEAAGANGGGADTFAYPLTGGPYEQTSWFGPRPYPGAGGSTNHGGIDIGAPAGTPILSVLPGTVTTAAYSDGYGNMVEVNHGNYSTLYGHMSSITVKAGDVVGKGQQIGLVGSTGNSTGPHLHLSMYDNTQGGVAIDPQPYYEGAQVTGGNTLISAIQNAYNISKGIAPVMTLGNVAYNPSEGAAQWTPQVLQALSMLGQPADLLPGVLYAIDSESSGNPNAINLTDSNAAAGHPSQGLLQTIPSTFAAYALPGYDTNITDPLSNILAGLNYMIQRYGSIAAVINPRLGGWYGYATGTPAATPGVHIVGENGPELISFNGGEKVFTNSESRALLEKDNNTTNTSNRTSNTPITISVNIDTINNNEDLDFTIDKFTSMLSQTLDEILYKDPYGVAVG